ncbi:MAG: glycerate dehydrogenase [Phycisphaera sp.]|nr:glycerate dehydrogenase [Phycisphaera sp.]
MPDKPHAIYWLGASQLQAIYGPEEQRDIAELTHVLADTGTPPEQLDGVELVFSGWGAPKFDEALLKRMPKLKAVFYGAGSVKKLVSDAMWDRGVRITSAYSMNAVPVSEYTLGTILLSLKHFWRMSKQAHLKDRFKDRNRIQGGYRSVVGLISLGQIGRRVCRLLAGFDMKVIAYDPFILPDDAGALGVELRTLEEVFAESDVVSLHTPWLKETEGMVTGQHFASMKPYATFINTSRGAVVRENELIEVARQRPDLQFILDVTYPEPPVPGSPLVDLPNVLLTPHIAGAINGECRRMGRFMVDELKRYLAGQTMQSEITRERAAILA